MSFEKIAYGLEVLAQIANASDVVTLEAVAADVGISLSYAEQIAAAFRKRGYVRGTRGPGGGYTYVGDPKQLLFRNILFCIIQDIGKKKDVESFVEVLTSPGALAFFSLFGVATFADYLDRRENFLATLRQEEAA